MHLKRAIERLLVQPMCSLIATHQLHGGDCIRVDWERTLDRFTFVKQADGIPCAAMIERAGRALPARAHSRCRGILSDAASVNDRLCKVS